MEAVMRVAARAALARPLVGLLARPRQRGADAGLDRQIAALLELQRLTRYQPIDTMPAAQARAYAAARLAPLELRPARVAGVQDIGVPGPAGRVPVRLYTPHDAGPHAIVFLHGGGGVIGSIASYDALARHLAVRTRCTVASVGYRLGPEDRHPAAIEDACAAYDALAPQLAQAGKLVVAGDSFGGFLSAHVDRHARRGGGRRPDLQVLIYPLTDLTLTVPSIARLGDGYILTRPLIHWFRNHYLRPEDDPAAPSPTGWPDLAEAAPALVVTAGFDPLVDDGDRYAAQLRAAGVRVVHRTHPTLVHGFLSLAGVVTAARAATDQIAADIVAHLAS